jgi:hypothetical protein
MKSHANRKVALIALAGLVALPTMAAGPYDGQWSAQQNMGGSCGMVTVTLTVLDNKMSGSVTNAFYRAGIGNVAVAPDGSVAFNSYGRIIRPGTVKFSSNGFELHIDSSCGALTISGKKAN